VLDHEYIVVLVCLFFITIELTYIAASPTNIIISFSLNNGRASCL